MATKTSDKNDLTWDDLDEIFEAGDLANVFGCHRQTIYSLARRGIIPCFRPGNRILFKKSIVKAWIAANSLEDFFGTSEFEEAKETLDKYLD